MHAATDNKNSSFHIVATVSLCVLAYLLFQFTINPNFYTDIIHLLQQIAIVAILGVLGYFGISGFIWVRKRIDNRWLAKVGPLELFKICNDISIEMQSGINNLLSSEKGIDDVDESLIIGGRPECFADCYGLVVIAMTHYDNNFLQSNRFEELHARVLNRLVNASKEKYTSINVDMDLVETQLKKAKTKDLYNIMQGVEYYQEQSAENKSDPLKLLVQNFSERNSLKGAKNLRRLETTSKVLLEKIDALIQNYKN